MWSGGDGDVLPERDPVDDLGRRLLGLGVVPGGVLAAPAVVLEREVGRRALPRADRVRAAVADDVLADGGAREVVVALDDDGVVALGDRHAVPGGGGHELLLRRWCGDGCGTGQEAGRWA